MNVVIDPHSGFCFGVTKAIETAEQELKNGEKLYCLGDIVHNTVEVERLKELGLVIIDHDQFRNLHHCKVLVRAHGEPPETYRVAFENNIELIDATCPVVLKLQNKILQGYRRMKDMNGQVVIYGKKGHAEVNGLNGQTGGDAIIVEGENDISAIDFSHPVILYSQTTMGKEGFKKIKAAIGDRMAQVNKDHSIGFSSFDTICGQVSNRFIRLQKFAGRFDCIIFVSSPKSSNGMYLFELCKSINPRSHFISGKDDLDQEWFRSAENVGICGGTSTPRWLMEEIAGEVKRLNS